jgi:hypothetical protein
MHANRLPLAEVRGFNVPTRAPASTAGTGPRWSACVATWRPPPQKKEPEKLICQGYHLQISPGSVAASV